MVIRNVAVVAVMLGWTGVATAQESIRLQFDAGKVSLSTRNAPVRAILAEWARLGGATIVNGDRVTGPPITLELSAVPERQALDIVLRDVAGYMIAARSGVSSGASTFDRILILPTSVAPPPAPSGSRPRPQRPPTFTQPPGPGLAGAAADADQAEQDGVDDPGTDDPAAAQPGGRGPAAPRIVRPPIVAPADPNASDTDEATQPNDDLPAVQTTPSNPFGIPAGSSARPGVVTPVPQRPQQSGPARVQ
jgi:hypothetical protein